MTSWPAASQRRSTRAAAAALNPPQTLVNRLAVGLLTYLIEGDSVPACLTEHFASKQRLYRRTWIPRGHGLPGCRAARWATWPPKN